MIKRLIDKLGSTVYVQIWQNRIKEADASHDNREVGVKPNKENYLRLAFWVVVLLGALWVSISPV
ncbi:hypothetical protein SAMN04487960_109174 [Marinobacter mobilis]|uniref:Uncharacterized protein n=1 Tax=Marinobacter mobilis TaxID=488533 RepID=A0A1H3BV29_9GAMM|nr:hypothetical protein SAMN04487960_109174 [Marinobacter mobilis]